MTRRKGDAMNCPRCGCNEGQLVKTYTLRSAKAHTHLVKCGHCRTRYPLKARTDGDRRQPTTKAEKADNRR